MHRFEALIPSHDQHRDIRSDRHPEFRTLIAGKYLRNRGGLPLRSPTRVSSRRVSMEAYRPMLCVGPRISCCACIWRRAANRLQSTAPLIAADNDSSSLEIVCLDPRLTDAAQREVFLVIRL
jgi:hypothetical protein